MTAMIAFTSEEKLALLLSVLGDEIAQSAFSGMVYEQAGSLRKMYDDFKSDPPSSEEVEFVIGDFLRYFDFAMDTLGLELGEHGNQQATKDQDFDDEASRPTIFPVVTPSEDPVADLNRLDAYQVTKAIETDHPKTIALVLRMVHVKQAARVLEQLEQVKRREVVAYLTQDSTVPAPIVRQVLKTTVDRACAIAFRPPTIDQSKVLADLMRSLQKQLRLDLMKQLAETNEKLYERVKEKLYLFEDILRLDDRDVQKLLSQIETDSLIVGLQRCDEELANKLLGNLSKRARETIVEEMEYKKTVSDEEVTNSRVRIVEVLAHLDEAGEIKL